MARSAITVLAALTGTLALIGTPALPAGPAVIRSSSDRAGLMYVLGDSWSAGLYADPDHTLAQDAADDLGMESTVDAQSGTGYLSAPFGTQTYPERAAAISVDAPVRLVVIQGGSNDVDDDLDALPAAVTDTVAAVRRALPRAQIALLGPGPDPWPITGQQRVVDAMLETAASRANVPYISPMAERWFTGSTVRTIIDPDTDHPTVEGDRILGRRLADDLQKLLAARPGLHRRAHRPARSSGDQQRQ
jgi:lysophospholipase L1-like esterase